MKCPFCKRETRVLESRDTHDDALRRRRECLKCGKRFTTYERQETTNILVVKKSGSVEQFSRQKVFSGILKATEKRPISSEQLEKMMDEIEEEVKTSRGNKISTTRLGDLVMQKLKRIDKVAYIRFAAVYREFKDVESFEQELKELRKKR